MDPSLVDSNREALLQELAREHEALKERVRELGARAVLTSSEKLEYARLKKLKLRTKDRIRWLSTQT